MSYGALCGSTYLEVKMPVVFCTTCERPRRMLYQLAAWYGAEWTCLSCGEQFSADEGRKDRPFVPRWRQANIAKAKEFWQRHGRKRLSKRELFASMGL